MFDLMFKTFFALGVFFLLLSFFVFFRYNVKKLLFDVKDVEEKIGPEATREIYESMRTKAVNDAGPGENEVSPSGRLISRVIKKNEERRFRKQMEPDKEQISDKPDKKAMRIKKKEEKIRKEEERIRKRTEEKNRKAEEKEKKRKEKEKEPDQKRTKKEMPPAMNNPAEYTLALEKRIQELEAKIEKMAACGYSAHPEPDGEAVYKDQQRPHEQENIPDRSRTIEDESTALLSQQQPRAVSSEPEEDESTALLPADPVQTFNEPTDKRAENKDPCAITEPEDETTAMLVSPERTNAREYRNPDESTAMLMKPEPEEKTAMLTEPEEDEGTAMLTQTARRVYPETERTQTEQSQDFPEEDERTAMLIPDPEPEPEDIPEPVQTEPPDERTAMLTPEPVQTEPSDEKTTMLIPDPEPEPEDMPEAAMLTEPDESTAALTELKKNESAASPPSEKQKTQQKKKKSKAKRKPKGDRIDNDIAALLTQISEQGKKKK